VSGAPFLVQRVGLACLRVGFAVLALVSFASAVRLLPLLLDDTVALSTTLVFFQILAVPGLQTVALIALPTGFALAGTDLVARGEALALACSGVSPWKMARATLPVLAVALALPLVVTLAWGEKAQSPGVLLSSMVERAAASCGPERPVSRVPWALLVVLCQGTERRFVLAAARPGQPNASAFLVRARALEFAPDAREAVFHEVQAELVGPPGVRLSTSRLLLRGGAPFALPLSVRSGARSVAVFVATIAASLVSFVVLVTRREARRWIALGVSGAAPALVVLSAIEARGASLPWSWSWLLLVPVAAVLPALGFDAWSRPRRSARFDGIFRRGKQAIRSDATAEASAPHNPTQPPTSHV
jgi:hypothetical protein